VITAGGALAIAGTLGILPAAYGGERRPVLVVLGAIGLVAALIALVGGVTATWWCVVALGSEYAVFIFGRDALDVRAPLVGGGLLVLSELIQWSRQTRSPVWEAWTSRRHLVDLAMLWPGSLVVGSIVLGTAALGGPGGLLLAIVGAIASGAILGLVLALARRHPARRPQ